jgi:hypothetical protein
LPKKSSNTKGNQSYTIHVTFSNDEKENAECYSRVIQSILEKKEAKKGSPEQPSGKKENVEAISDSEDGELYNL